MRCAECRSLVQQEADGEELLARSSLEQHLRACPACRTFQAGLQRLAEVARQAPPARPSAEFRTRLLDAVLADRLQPTPPPEPAPWARPWSLLLALAASLLVGLGLWLWGTGGAAPQPEPDLVEAVQPAPESVGATANLSDSVREAGSASTALVARMADAVVERTREILPSVPTPTLPSLAGIDPMTPIVEPPGRTLVQAGQAVAEGFQPVTDSARRAFDLFLRELPQPPDEHPGL